MDEKLLDFQTHQVRLMPLLAGAFAVHFSFFDLRASLRELEQDIAAGKAVRKRHEFVLTYNRKNGEFDV